MKPKGAKNRSTNPSSQAGFTGQHPPVTRVKTTGRVGSPTPPSYLKGGLTVDNNDDAQSHDGGLGAAVSTHLSPSHKGDVWSPRVRKARAMAKPNPKPYANPVNVDRPSLKRVKPD